MPKKKPQTFEQLKKHWYGKLKKSGFEDAEQDEDNLKKWSVSQFSRLSIEVIQAKQAYYDMARTFLEHNEFKTRLDEIIWAYHTEGISARNIAVTLTKARKKTIHYTTVWHVIHRLEHEMKMLYLAGYKETHNE